MPRKTKEQTELENNSGKETKAPKKTTSTKKTSTSKKSSSTTKATVAKKAPTTSKSSTARKATTTKKSNTSKATTKKASATKKSIATKKATTKKSVSKRASTKKPEIVEYYDLPYRYNQTIIKVLAQTPTTLFIYWDISDTDRKNFEKQYGENFFEITKPILIIYNDTLGYNFEVEINDFANSWYLHVADSKCDYRIELGRRPIVKSEKLNTDYIYVTSSNKIESPNDRILFNKEQKMVYFRNVKTKVETSKYINTISFMQNIGKIYDIYDLYKAIYQNEDVEEIYNTSNPSSGNPSSHF